MNNNNTITNTKVKPKVIKKTIKPKVIKKTIKPKVITKPKVTPTKKVIKSKVINNLTEKQQ
jgi:hypothetical protein